MTTTTIQFRRTPTAELPRLAPHETRTIAAALRGLCDTLALDGELIGYECLVQGLTLAGRGARQRPRQRRHHARGA
jgi:hypothetical protein